MNNFPTDILNYIDSFIPKCANCGCVWFGLANYKMDYYFTPIVPHEWIEGDFESNKICDREMNEKSRTFIDAFDENFAKELADEDLSEKISFKYYFHHGLIDRVFDHYDVSIIHPDLSEYAEKISIDYRNLCDNCENDLTWLSTTVFCAFYENKMKHEDINNYTEDTHVVRVKNVYYGEKLNYLLIRVGELFDYGRDLLFEDLFGLKPDYEIVRPINGYVIDRCLEGLGAYCFPGVYKDWLYYIDGHSGYIEYSMVNMSDSDESETESEEEWNGGFSMDVDEEEPETEPED